ncbi:hypothetical protein ACN20G_26340 [Streptomyces sp. BI20]|uniref:hypothetical protein n=1 Tax=Streptomyces sp. BI20 TaxID=3403460 RepID=UPI003C76F162
MPGAKTRPQFEVTPDIRVFLAYWQGNASAVHRQLLQRAHANLAHPTPDLPAGAPPRPSCS